MPSALWQLVEQGVLRFGDKISDHVPEFAAMAKETLPCLRSSRIRAGSRLPR